MSQLTNFLKLFKWNTSDEADLEEEFDIDTSMNDNWDKIDKFAKEAKDKLDGLSNYDDTKIKQDISNIQKEQATQNERIQANTDKNTSQDELIAKLKGNMFNLTAEGTSINVQDSSDLPSVLEVSGGVRQKTREGYNLIDTSKLVVASSSGMTATYLEENGKIRFNGTTTSFGNFFLRNLNKTLKAGTYTVKSNLTSKELNTIRLNAKDGSIIAHTIYDNKVIEIAEDVELYEILVQIRSGITLSNFDFEIWLYEGTEPKPFEAYGVSPSPDYPSEVETVEGSLEINKVNKNWFDIDGYSYIPNWQELTINNNTFKLYSKTTGNWWDTLNYKYFVKNISRNITLSFNITDIQLSETGNVCRILIDQYDELNNNLNANTYYDYKSVGQYSKNINLKENCSYIILRIYIINGKNIVGTYVEFENFQLEQGEAATDCIPHESEVYNLPIQQPMLSGDYFIKEADGWKEVHGWKKYVFIGDEEFGGAGVKDVSFITSITDYVISNDIICFSNYFKSVPNVTGASGIGSKEEDNIIAFINNHTNYRFYVKSSQYYATTLKSFLAERYNAGNPVYIWYKLATPTKLPCTPEQAAVLEQLYNMPTYRPVTNIFTQEDLANLKLNYVADSKIYVDNKINAMQANLDTINQLLSTTATSAMLLNNMQADLESEVI